MTKIKLTAEDAAEEIVNIVKGPVHFLDSFEEKLRHTELVRRFTYIIKQVEGVDKDE